MVRNNKSNLERDENVQKICKKSTIEVSQFLVFTYANLVYMQTKLKC